MSERTIATNAKAYREGVHENEIKLPELLAPAGGREQLVAAVNNGADAVYMGGSLFNARMRAENFGIGSGREESSEGNHDDLKWAIDYAHSWGVKVYITLNTLIKEKELAKAFEYACSLYELGADAVILQDMGLARLIHKYLPDFPMHLSTQGTVYNESGVGMAAELGFRRVVPARECSLEEIGHMCQAGHDKVDGPVEIEVFVHGALCMCYSGQCQMSRLLGASADGKKQGSARSGNRGLCAQPCRLRYQDDKGLHSYALSPRDICTLDNMPELIEAGVDSFKIEGRLKSAEYVAIVTRIYRKYLDKIAALRARGEDIYAMKIEAEDREKLLQIFNRGGFTEGYLHGNPGQKILSGESPKNQGVLIGKVTAVRDAGGSASAKRKLVDVKLNEGAAVETGDGVELSQTGNVVTYFKDLGNGNVRIGDFKTGKGITINPGENVRKVTDRNLAKEALEAKPVGKSAIDMIFTGHIGKPASLVAVCEGKAVTVSHEKIIEKALKKPADSERIKEQLSKLGDTPFEAGEIEIRVDSDAMIPVSAINDLRRQAVNLALVERVNNHRQVTENTLNEALNEIEEMKSSGSENAAAIQRKFRLVPLEIFMEKQIRSDDEIPYILNVSKGNLDTYIKEHFQEITEAVKACGIAIGNLGWIREFQRAGVKVYGDYGLNVYNSQARAAFAQMGVDVIEWSDEASARRNVREPKWMNRIPLMITEHPLKSEFLVDRKGVKHDVMKWYSGDKFLIF